MLLAVPIPSGGAVDVFRGQLTCFGFILKQLSLDEGTKGEMTTNVTPIPCPTQTNPE